MIISEVGKSNNPDIPQIAAGQSTGGKNSIWNNSANTASEGNNVTFSTAFDKKIEELVKKFPNFSKEDIINFFKKCEINEDRIKSMSPEDLSRFFSFWEKRISGCKTVEELTTLAEEHKISKNMGLAGILRKYLPKGVTSLNQVSDEELQKAVESFIADKMKEPHQGADADKQMKFFMHLLDATKDEDKIRLYNAFKKAAAQNQQVSNMLNMMLLSIAKSEDVQKLLNQIPIETFETLGLSKDEVLASIKILVENGNLEYVEKIKAELLTKLEKFYNDNNDFIKDIKQKIETKKSELGRELSDEEIFKLLQDSPDELKLYKAFSTIKSMLGGFSLGTANNKIIDEQAKTNNLNDLFAKINEYGYTEDILNEIKTYIQEHPEDFQGNLDNITKLLNSATGGDFGEVYSANSTNGTDSYSSATDSNGLFIQQLTDFNLKQLQSSIENKKNKLIKNDKKITLEKTPAPTTSMVGMTAFSILENLKNGIFKTTSEAVIIAVKSYNKLAESGKSWCIQILSNMSKSVANIILNSGVSGSALVDLAQSGIDIDAKKITTNYDARKQLEQA